MEVEEFSPNTSELPRHTKREKKPQTKPATKKVELFGMKGTDTEESACTGVLKASWMGSKWECIQTMLK